MDKSLNKVIKSHVILAVLSVVAVILMAGGVTYALFQIDRKNTTNQTVAIGTLNAEITSINGGIVVSDLYPQSASDITDSTKKYEFTISNTGTYDVKYEVYLKDATDALLASSSTYSGYKRISSEHYSYINYKLDGKTYNSLSQSQDGEKFIVLTGYLKAGSSENHYLQFFLDNGDTTETGAPNDIAGSVISLDIYFDGAVEEVTVPEKIIASSKGTLTNFDDIAPSYSLKDNEFNETVRNSDMSSYQSRYITYSDTYTFNENTGSYTLIDPQVCQYSSCYSNLIGKYIVSYSGSTSTSPASSSNLKIIYKVGEGTTLTNMKYIASSLTPIYDYSADGVYEMKDDYGTSYYFRGAVENNYVKFGQNASGQDMYWRIIRVNGDRSLRMIYDGTSAHANEDSDSDRVAMTSVSWNETNTNDAKYVGYMYGGANGTASTSKEHAQQNETDSNIKTKIDEWYKKNIIDTGYASAVSDELFCNDRSIPGQSVTNWTDDTGMGYGANKTGYGALGRFMTGNNSTELSSRMGVQPSFKCAQKKDAFTVSDTEVGNGALTYPVGLITADEIVAGGGPQTDWNPYCYLNKGSAYWSLSPNSFSPNYSENNATIFYWQWYGYLEYTLVTDLLDVAPVINLSAEYSSTLIGSGTMNDPYRTA